MKKLKLLVTLGLIFTITFAGSKPDWVKNNGISSKYPEQIYITGYGIAGGDNLADKKLKAEQNAMSALSKQFHTRIKSSIITEESEQGDDYYTYFKSTINAKTRFTLIGAKTYFYQDRDITHALAVMNIQSAVSNYTQRFKSIKNQLQKLMQNAENAEKNDQLQEAINYYKQSIPEFIKLGEIRSILNILKNNDPFSEFDRINSEFSLSLPEIEKRINQALKKDINSIDDAAFILTEQLMESKKYSHISLSVYPFTYDHSDFSSQFSVYLRKAMLPVLTDKSTVIENLSRQTSPDAILTGIYKIVGDNCIIQATLSKNKTGELLNAATIEFDKKLITNKNLEIKPHNFQQAMEDSRVFYSSDIVSGALSLEAWTNRGSEKIVYTENDNSTLMVRVNKPCYLQCIYHLANGMRVLMYNNYYIDVSKVNKVVAMPDTFVVCAPFGVERWQIFAKTDKFPKVPLKGQTIDGEYYDNILAEDLKKYTATTRGLKKKQAKTEMSEETLTITTIKK